MARRQNGEFTVNGRKVTATRLKKGKCEVTVDGVTLKFDYHNNPKERDLTGLLQKTKRAQGRQPT